MPLLQQFATLSLALQALDKQLVEHQAAAECMVDDILQDCQAVGSSVIAAVQSDIRGFLSEVMLQVSLHDMATPGASPPKAV